MKNQFELHLLLMKTYELQVSTFVDLAIDMLKLVTP